MGQEAVIGIRAGSLQKLTSPAGLRVIVPVFWFATVLIGQSIFGRSLPNYAYGFLYALGVVFAAWSGFITGILASLAWALLVPFLFVPNFKLQQIEIGRLIFLFLSSGLISWTAHFRRRSEAALRESNEHLGRRVAERTEELSAAVISLRAEVAQRFKAEQALKESEMRFRQLADAMPQIVWTARADGYVDYYNERWYELTGFDRDKFGDISWEPILHPDDVQHCYDTWYGSVRSGEPYQIEYRFWDRHRKQWCWYLGRALPVRDSDGRISRWFGSSTDIDEQKRTEQRLRRSNEDLSQFAYVASHDLQEPLRTMAIYSEYLERKYRSRLDANGEEFIRYIIGSATRMRSLIEDLLTYSRATAESGRHLQPASSREALDQAILNLKAAITDARARIEVPPDMPVVMTDPAQLSLVFQNLISNAIKYRKPGSVPTVEIGVGREANGWRFSVQDEGIGFASEYSDRIFGIFKRLHGTDVPGTGIGLSICKTIVERHGGRIWAESEENRGAAFHFTLPAGDGIHNTGLLH
jgi:PAS domain S-box-containing protein